MGRSLKHVRSCVIHSSRIYLWIGSCYVPQARMKKSIISFWVVPVLIMTRFQPVAKSSPNFSIHLLREQTYSLETSFGCLSTELCHFFTRADDPCSHKTKYPYGWYPTSQKNIHCRGSAFQSVLIYMWLSHTVFVDAAHCHTPAGGQVWQFFLRMELFFFIVSTLDREWIPVYRILWATLRLCSDGGRRLAV